PGIMESIVDTSSTQGIGCFPLIRPNKSSTPDKVILSVPPTTSASVPEVQIKSRCSSEMDFAGSSLKICFQSSIFISNGASPKLFSLSHAFIIPKIKVRIEDNGGDFSIPFTRLPFSINRKRLTKCQPLTDIKNCLARHLLLFRHSFQ